MKNAIMKHKKIILAAICGVITLSLPISASAVGSLGRAEKIQSKGNLQYVSGNNEILIDSQDFYLLANEIDNLEKTAKWSSVSALQELPDVAIKAELKAKTEDEIASVKFEHIYNAINTSQAVKENETKATADDLSLGTAAWVNGTYIIGTGGSEKEFYRQGYIDGYAKNKGAAKVENIYHTHEGNASAVGGCYTNLTKDRVVSEYCGCTSWVPETDAYGTVSCRNCGHNNGCSDGYCNSVVKSRVEQDTYIGLGCGKTTDTIVGVKLSFN